MQNVTKESVTKEKKGALCGHLYYLLCDVDYISNFSEYASLIALRALNERGKPM